MNTLPKSLMIGEARNQELLAAATTYVYNQTPEGDLQAHFFFPPNFNYLTDRCPAIVFFHGGLWDISAATQFIPHCHHFASRGMVAITVEYRTTAKMNGTPEEAIVDAKSALSFFKLHAESLGIDAERIVAAGASAGGNAVLCAALHPHCEETLPAPRPAAMVLFGPISDTTVKGVGSNRFANVKNAKLLSPSSHLPQKGLPPCLIFHGKADRVVPFALSERFAKRYRRKRNRCEIMEFENAGHTFFNYNSDETNYELTLRAADHFLVELGLLEPDPLAGLLD
ncbi:MAG: alpha/beta hydrolase [Akkermansiaceae bacterium]|jgi:acetyl esterase